MGIIDNIGQWEAVFADAVKLGTDIFALLNSGGLTAQSPQCGKSKKYRGAKASPRHKLAAAMPHVADPATPTEFIRIPSTLDYWLNNQYGDCVTAEECFKLACENPELLVSDNDLYQFCRQHRLLNGANLTDVMDLVISEGLPVGGKLYYDGPYHSVDWTNWDVLTSAIAQGPVKIGVAADQLERCGAGNGNGWFGLNFRPDGDVDHCTSLCGYGSISYLATQLKVQVPSNVDGTKRGVGFFTWSSIGIVGFDDQSIQNITSEAWLRTPNTVTK